MRLVNKGLFLTIWVIFINFPLMAQVNFLPLETSPIQNNMLNSMPFYNENYTKLYYITRPQFYQYEVLTKPNMFTANDSIVTCVTQLGIISNIKKKFVLKKKNNVFTPMIWKSTDRTFMNDEFSFVVNQYPDSLLQHISLQVDSPQVWTLDSNLALVSTLPLKSEYSNYILPWFRNFIKENDTLFLIQYLDSTGSTIFRYNSQTQSFVDSFESEKNQGGAIQLFNALNDSTLVVAKDSVFMLLNKQLQIVPNSVKQVQTSFSGGNVPGGFTPLFFHRPDTSYYHLTEQAFPAVNPARDQFQRAQVSDGTRDMLERINHDTVWNQIQGTNLGHGLSNTNFIYTNHKYSCSILGEYEPVYLNVIPIMKFGNNNKLKWVKYAGFDAYYTQACILATPDSGCLVLANRLDINNNDSLYDLYYIKLDKNGNQEFNYLPVSTNNIAKNILAGVTLFPNPAQNTINFRYKNNNTFTLNVYSLDGKKIMQQERRFNQEIDISTLGYGIYGYHIMDKEGNTKSGLFSKEY